MEKVTVIVLNCNASQYLEKCFASIFDLDYQDFEVIMVDDNSSDDSVDLVREKFPRVTIISNDGNLGLLGHWFFIMIATEFRILVPTSTALVTKLTTTQ